MKSKNMERFNHDPDASRYDEDVLNEDNPIRAGYEDLLTWIAIEANEQKARRILDLGIGTGNLSTKINAVEIVGVDTSKKMMDMAAVKLTSKKFDLIQADLLEFFNEDRGSFDCIVSSYAIHHLEPNEREELFQLIWNTLRPGGIALFGDLMFESLNERRKILAAYRSSGQSGLVDDIEDEFFWDLESDTRALKACGFDVKTKKFSDLSWGVLATRPKSS
ncbi:MAG: class I SAM-dependent methyltransferase [Bdellovibrionota bacterium]